MPMPRKRPLVNPRQPYAYTWSLDGEIILAGHGRNNRGRPTTQSSWSGRHSELIAILKLRRDDIKWVVHPCNDLEEARALEAELIRQHKPKFNTAPGTGGYPGMHSPEGLESIRIAATGRPVSQEVKDARRARMMGNSLTKGMRHSEEVKQKISQANKGKTVSDLTRQRASERMAERNVKSPPRKGKPCSEEHKRKLREAAARRRQNALQVQERQRGI